MEQIQNRENDVHLYDNISTETWLRIADCVQKFTITDGNEKEFLENLEMLQKFLVGTEVNLEVDSKQIDAKHFFNVGLATLVQSIYEIKSNGDKKDHFRNQIYTLEDIGIKQIQFHGNSFHNITSCKEILVSHGYPKEKNPVYVHKTYTDASFCVQNEGGYSHMFEMTDLQSANYFLHIILSSKTEPSILKSVATLANFDGVYPTKEEILSMRFPQLKMDDNIIDWQVTNGNRVTQNFETYTRKKTL